MPSLPSNHKAKSSAPRQHAELRRGSASSRGYNYRWQKARKRWLMKHPICVECAKQDIFTPATEVDHIDPHRGDMVKFWDESNWQSLCKSHHSAKTARGL